MKKFFKKIFSASTVGLLFQGTFVPLTGGLPGNSSGAGNAAGSLSNIFNQTSPNLAQFFNDIFTLALSAGAILAVLQLARAGWMYMGAQDMWGSKQKAKELITDAVIGLLLLIGIWIILNQINPCLLNLNVLQDFSGNGANQCGGAQGVSYPPGSFQ